MTEFRFHHLERLKVEQALPALLERVLEEGLNAVVQASSAEEVEALNERLWTYSDESFVPHGSKRDGDPETQPVYLTDEADNPNGATVRVLLSGVASAPFAAAGYARVLVLFDGRDAEALQRARTQWTEAKAAGAELSYWREGEDGGWVRAR